MHDTKSFIKCRIPQPSPARKQGQPLYNSKAKSLTSWNEYETNLKECWQKEIVQFEKLKEELNENQKAILKLYTNMEITHQKMTALGQNQKLPAPDELHIMNVTNLTPEQLLKLCAYQSSELDNQLNDYASAVPVSIDSVAKMPSKLIEEYINSLFQKVSEFKSENKSLASICKKVKNEYAAEMAAIANFIRKSIKETSALQTRQEKLETGISMLKIERDDIIKQLQEVKNRKPFVNHNKMKEMEQMLKEEKCKNSTLKDRLCRATEQVRISKEHESQLDTALEQSRANCRNLERTIQLLKEENRKVNDDFSIELNKFSDSIAENTTHLQEIAEAREKLESEKEELENRLSELSAHYNESMKNMKAEMSSHIAKVIENEKKYSDEKQERLKLLDKVESLCEKLSESESRYKDLCMQLQDRDTQINKYTELQIELDSTKTQLNTANKEVDKYHDMIAKQNEVIKNIERNLKESASAEKSLQKDLTNTKEYTKKLEQKILLLEQQLQYSEDKINSYEEQITSLNLHLSQIKESFGEFENITQQQITLHETIQQNAELAKATQKKELEIKQYVDSITKQEQAIQQRDEIIKMLSDKEREHTNIINLLQHNLEMRTQADINMKQQISEKDAEISSLFKNLETKKEQINQLEKIILR
ncbi:hypothetical protein ACJJTC_007764 [Scirpophaga incertulas]